MAGKDFYEALGYKCVGKYDNADDGTINLDAEPIEKLELECGQSIELVSTSMSAGFNLVISYEQK